MNLNHQSFKIAWPGDSKHYTLLEVTKVIVGSLWKPPRALSTSTLTVWDWAPKGNVCINNSCSSSLSPRWKQEQQQHHENKPFRMIHSRSDCGTKPANMESKRYFLSTVVVLEAWCENKNVQEDCSVAQAQLPLVVALVFWIKHTDTIFKAALIRFFILTISQMDICKYTSWDESTENSPALQSSQLYRAF